jgi:hypothetical protein
LLAVAELVVLKQLLVVVAGLAEVAVLAVIEHQRELLALTLFLKRVLT